MSDQSALTEQKKSTMCSLLFEGPRWVKDVMLSGVAGATGNSVSRIQILISLKSR